MDIKRSVTHVYRSSLVSGVAFMVAFLFLMMIAAEKVQDEVIPSPVLAIFGTQ